MVQLLVLIYLLETLIQHKNSKVQERTTDIRLKVLPGLQVVTILTVTLKTMEETYQTTSCQTHRELPHLINHIKCRQVIMLG